MKQRIEIFEQIAARRVLCSLVGPSLSASSFLSLAMSPCLDRMRTMFGVAQSTVLGGLMVFAIVKSALGGVIAAPSVFSLFFALVCTAGGGAFGDTVVSWYRHHAQRRASAISES